MPSAAWALYTGGAKYWPWLRNRLQAITSASTTQATGRMRNTRRT